MGKKNTVLIYAIVIGLALYLLDSVIFYLQYSKDYTFLQAFLTKLPVWELIGRLLILSVIVIIGIVLNRKADIFYLKPKPKPELLSNEPDRSDFCFQVYNHSQSFRCR